MGVTELKTLNSVLFAPLSPPSFALLRRCGFYRAGCGTQLFITQEKLRNANVLFITEKDLRQRGEHKTPDVLLELPIHVEGKVVCWIDRSVKIERKTERRINSVWCSSSKGRRKD